MEKGERSTGTLDADVRAVEDTQHGRGGRPGGTWRSWVGFLATWGVAWFVLDRLASSPPRPVTATCALGGAFLVLVAGERIVDRTAARDLLAVRAFRRFKGRGVAVAAVAGLAYVAALLSGASVLGIDLELRSDWPLVLVGVLVLHGLAEELVWRGFAFARLRSVTTFRAAVLWSIPLIALTHTPILINEGLLVGSLAVLTAAVTCLPFAYVWEHGGRTIWAPALLHGLIGTWQLFDRSYPLSFSMVVLLASITVPLMVIGADRVLRGHHANPQEKLS